MLHYAKGNIISATIRQTLPQMYAQLDCRTMAPYFHASKIVLRVFKKVLRPEVKIKQKYIATVATMMINANIKTSRGRIDPAEKGRLLDLLQANWRSLGIDKDKREKFNSIMQDESKREKLLKILERKEIFCAPKYQLPAKNIVEGTRLSLAQFKRSFLISGPKKIISQYKGDFLLEGDQRIIKITFLHGQEHLFKYWEKLSLHKQDELLTQIRELDFRELQKVFVEAKFIRKAIQKESYADPSVSEVDRQKAIKEGRNMLDKTAVIVIAGGDASRFINQLLDILFDENAAAPEEINIRKKFFKKHPELKRKTRTAIAKALYSPKYSGYSKHSFPVTDITGVSPLEISANKITLLSAQAKTKIPVCYVSGCNNAEMIEAFFKNKDFFNLPEKETDLIVQGKIPMLDPYGKIIMQDKNHIAFNPNGTFGALYTPISEGVTEKWKKMGKKYILMLSADDPLALTGETIEYWLGSHKLSHNKLSVVTFPAPLDNEGKVKGKFGKVLVNQKKELKIVEFVDQPPQMQQTPGWINAGIYIINMEKFNKLDPNSFPHHLSEPKSLSTDLGEQLVAKLELWAPDILDFFYNTLKIRRRKIGLIKASEEETSPIKDVSGTLKIKNILFRRTKKLLKFLGIHPHDESIPVEVKELPAHDGKPHTLEITVGSKAAIKLPKGATVVKIAPMENEKETITLEYTEEGPGILTITDGETEEINVKKGDRIKITRSV